MCHVFKGKGRLNAALLALSFPSLAPSAWRRSLMFEHGSPPFLDIFVLRYSFSLRGLPFLLQLRRVPVKLAVYFGRDDRAYNSSAASEQQQRWKGAKTTKPITNGVPLPRATRL